MADETVDLIGYSLPGTVATHAGRYQKIPR